MSNEAKMTLEERMVQTLKSDHLMKLVGDEDAITELVRRAIREALYQPRRVLTGYGGYEEKDSPVVDMARSVARDAAKQVADEIVQSVMQDEKFRTEVRGAMKAAIPHIMMTAFEAAVRSEASLAAFNATKDLASRFSS